MDKAQLTGDIREKRARLEQVIDRIGVANTSDHYREHRESLESWLASRG